MTVGVYPLTDHRVARTRRRNMKAVVFAGGRGTRLAPYTSILPKPLMPIGDHSILELVLRQLAACGITDVTLCVGYLAHLIEAVLSNRAPDGVEIAYAHEEEALGTAAPLRFVPGLDRTFIAMNGDVLTTLDYDALLRYHRRARNILTIATRERPIQIDYGVLHLGENGRGNRVYAYTEKPCMESNVSMGIYVLEPEALRTCRRRADLISRISSRRCFETESRSARIATKVCGSTSVGVRTTSRRSLRGSRQRTAKTRAPTTKWRGEGSSLLGNDNGRTHAGGKQSGRTFRRTDVGCSPLRRSSRRGDRACSARRRPLGMVEHGPAGRRVRAQVQELLRRKACILGCERNRGAPPRVARRRLRLGERILVPSLNFVAAPRTRSAMPARHRSSATSPARTT